jgi:hypothetical protein
MRCLAVERTRYCVLLRVNRFAWLAVETTYATYWVEPVNIIISTARCNEGTCLVFDGSG